MKKRILSLILAIMMVTSITVTTAFAANGITSAPNARPALTESVMLEKNEVRTVTYGEDTASVPVYGGAIDDTTQEAPKDNKTVVWVIDGVLIAILGVVCFIIYKKKKK